MFVLVNDGGGRTSRPRPGAAPPRFGWTGLTYVRRARRHPYRRNSDPIARLKPAIRVCPPAVDPHLAAPDQTVDMRLGDTATKPDQEIVQPLAVVIFINGDHRGGCAGGGGA